MRRPYFLVAAVVPVVGAVIFALACLAQRFLHSDSAGGNIGNYDLSGLFEFIFWVSIVSFLDSLVPLRLFSAMSADECSPSVSL
jgi:hypothetical protein